MSFNSFILAVILLLFSLFVFFSKKFQKFYFFFQVSDNFTVVLSSFFSIKINWTILYADVTISIFLCFVVSSYFLIFSFFDDISIFVVFTNVISKDRKSEVNSWFFDDFSLLLLLILSFENKEDWAVMLRMTLYREDVVVKRFSIEIEIITNVL